MQFVKDGPDIPERLLQAHEDGRVVFFCGAGISYPAGLPGFKGLVEKLSDYVGEPMDEIERRWFEAKEFDRTIGHFESRIHGSRPQVRQHLRQILAPKVNFPRALTTHYALVTLARDRQGVMRIVTTNFDTLFEVAREKYGLPEFTVHPDPPGRSRWEGLVYLHGRMPPQPSTDDLDRLVLSDVDFGKAYLTEAWAARFLASLFRDSVICFIGYSVEDPVLRYMTTAQATNEGALEMFAFAEFSDEADRKRQAEAWAAKHVTPMLYPRDPNHRNLHRSLHVWASVHRDGPKGRERLVARYAGRDPRASSTRNDFVGRMLWALGDPSGLPARRFAEMDPVPSLEWLERLSESRYGHADLRRFGVPAHAVEDGDLKFSLLDRPPPYPLAQRMALVYIGLQRTHWDEVMKRLAAWLTRHLDDPALVLWLAQCGGQIHDDLISLIENRLNELTKLEHDDNTAELARIREGAPKAIPGPLMRTLWRMLLTGRVKSWLREFDLYRWSASFRRDGFTTTLRLELRETLTPRVSLRKPSGWQSDDRKRTEPVRIKDLVEWDLVLTADHVHYAIADLSRDDQWTAALPSLLADFSALLCDALDLMRELGTAGDRHDWSSLHQPSIGKHPQNRDFQDWTALIDLTRDAWLATAECSPERAALEAELWWQTPYPVFKRLAFFAAAHGEVIAVRRALDWLLADEHWWLWSVETEREVLRLLVALAPRLDVAMRTELEQAILVGPSRTMFRSDIEPEHWPAIVDHDIWLRLAKIAQTGVVLSDAGRARLDALAARYPDWRLSDDQREEFPYWMESGWVGDTHPWLTSAATPRRRRDLIEWLRRQPALDRLQKDDWQQRCRNNFATPACALCALAKEGVWPEGRWREALQAWSEEKHAKRSWRYMAPVVIDAPAEVLEAFAPSVSEWLQAIAETFEGHEAIFLALARRILALDHQDGIDTDHHVTRAINHPSGQVTRALLNWWSRGAPENGQGLPDEIKLIFTEICDTRIDKFRHGRVLLAANLVYLFQVDLPWAKEHLLPLFDWKRSEHEARAAWAGFLWNPRLYVPLMRVLKPAFLDTARHYHALGSDGGRYAAVLTIAALDPGDVFTHAELADATRALPPDGLRDAAKTLVRQMESAGDQRAAYWANRVVPYLQDIWPKGRQHATPAIAERFGRLCIAAQDAFPEAVVRLRSWLQAQDNPFVLVHPLHEAALCGRFPEPALEFLNRVIGDQTLWLPEELGACLIAIREAAPQLGTDPRHERLANLVRQRQH